MSSEETTKKSKIKGTLVDPEAGSLDQISADFVLSVACEEGSDKASFSVFQRGKLSRLGFVQLIKVLKDTVIPGLMESAEVTEEVAQVLLDSMNEISEEKDGNS